MVRDLRIPPDTRLVGSSPCPRPGVHRDQDLGLDSLALIRGFRTPAPCKDGGAGSGGRRSKARQGGNRGQDGGRLASGSYGDLRIADGWRARCRQLAALSVLSGSGDGGCFRWRRCAGARRSHRSEGDWRPRGDIGLVFRRAAGGGGDGGCEAGWVTMVMRCRS